MSSTRIDTATIRRLPKAVLHDHLDGGLRPATVVELAEAVGHTLPTTDPDELAAWYVEAANSGDLVRYIARSIWRDWCHAWKEGVFLSRAWEIVQYRVCQYTGSFKGNREHRILSHADRDKYFYPG